MRERLPPTRRGFLALLAGLGLAPLGSCFKETELDGDLDLLSRVFRSPALAARVGEAYLSGGGAERDESGLRAALGLPAANDELSTAEIRALLENLIERHREDFRRGRVSVVAGWHLSLTETRLCAVAHLRRRGAQSSAM